MKSNQLYEFRIKMRLSSEWDQQLGRDEVQRSASRNHETFSQGFFCVFTWSRYHCQEFTIKHYIVAIKKTGAWGCRGGDCLPNYQLSFFCQILQILFGEMHPIELPAYSRIWMKKSMLWASAKIQFRFNRSDSIFNLQFPDQAGFTLRCNRFNRVGLFLAFLRRRLVAAVHLNIGIMRNAPFFPMLSYLLAKEWIRIFAADIATGTNLVPSRQYFFYFHDCLLFKFTWSQF